MRILVTGGAGYVGSVSAELLLARGHDVTIVDSLVTDVVMPVVGLATGGTDFSNMFTVLRDGAKIAGPYASLAEAKAAGATVIAYGAFVNQIIQFLILAWVVFLMVKAINRMRRNLPPRVSV